MVASEAKSRLDKEIITLTSMPHASIMPPPVLILSQPPCFSVTLKFSSAL